MFERVLLFGAKVVLGVIAVIVLVMLSTVYVESRYKKVALPYVKKVVPLISRWDPDLTMSFFSEELLDQIDKDEFLEMNDTVSQLGDLEGFDPPVFSSLGTSITLEDGLERAVKYQVKAKYSNAYAVITIELKELKDEFKISGINFNSDIFAQ
ncbi:MAG: hypothetical protein HWE20_04965 [Gammaproteobacteria bacterium]|nr:hypothetical protein [Gammaproteobacteria bacterium]